MPPFSFYTPKKYHKTSGLQMFFKGYWKRPAVLKRLRSERAVFVTLKIILSWVTCNFQTHFFKAVLQKRFYRNPFKLSANNSWKSPILENNILNGINLLKIDNRNTGTRCEICSKPMASFWCLVNFEHISHLVLVFLLLTLNM